VGEGAFEDVALRSRELEVIFSELGIPEEAITSSSVRLWDEDPRYKVNYSQTEIPTEAHAQNRLEVRVPDHETVGRLVTAAVRRAGAKASGPEWQLRAANDLHRDALRMAAEDARAKGEAQADAMGVRLGPVLEIMSSDRDYSGIEHHDYLGRFNEEPGPSMEAAFKIHEGRVYVDASIEVTFSLE
jgi:uncharacterized protein YggE